MGVPRITEEGVVAVARGCRDLRTLDLDMGGGSKSQRRLITDVYLHALARYCNRIVDLDVGYCTRITDAGLRGITRGCKLLQSVRLEKNKLVTGEGLATLAGCRYLRSLSITNLRATLDDALPCIGEECKLLETLTILDCRNVTDTSVAWVLHVRRPTLSCHVHGCKHISAPLQKLISDIQRSR